MVDEIVAAGGESVANTDDIATWGGGERVVSQATDEFGGLDVLVNNAGILRDRMIFSMSEAEWDDVIRVHLKGTFITTRHAAAYWRDRAKAGESNNARVINTTSASGIYANPGQFNYGAVKAGVVAFTQIVAQELGRYVEGRLDEVIVRGGESLSPGELEDVLVQHPDVAEAAVAGVPDDEWGEVVAAALVLEPGATATEADLPYNETGKLLRRVLRAELESLATSRQLELNGQLGSLK